MDGSEATSAMVAPTNRRLAPDTPLTFHGIAKRISRLLGTHSKGRINLPLQTLATSHPMAHSSLRRSLIVLFMAASALLGAGCATSVEGNPAPSSATASVSERFSRSDGDQLLTGTSPDGAQCPPDAPFKTCLAVWRDDDGSIVYSVEVSEGVTSDGIAHYAGHYNWAGSCTQTVGSRSASADWQRWEVTTFTLSSDGATLGASVGGDSLTVTTTAGVCTETIDPTSFVYRKTD